MFKMNKIPKFTTLSVFIFLFAIGYSHATMPIDCGKTAFGSISEAGEKDKYTFTAIAGDKIIIRTFNGTGIYARLNLYAPDGSVTNDLMNYGSINRTLAISGIYTIEVYNSSNGVGDYGLFFERLNNPCSAFSISCGQVISGSVTNLLDRIDFYRFSGSAGDRISINCVSTSGTGLSPYLKLYAPDGTDIAVGNNEIHKDLTVNGAYAIAVFNDTTNVIGNYSLILEKLDHPCYSVPISCGQVVAGSLSAANPYKFYHFKALNGDKITIRSVRSLGQPYLSLVTPSNTLINSVNSFGGISQIDAVITMEGTCNIIVNAQDISLTDYALTLQKTADPCNYTTVSFGKAIDSTIDPPVQIKPYKFTVDAGDTITICSSIKKLISGNFDVNLEIYDMTGNKIAASGDSLKFTVVSSGTYCLFVTDYNSDGAGEYRIMILKEDKLCSEIDLINPVVSINAPKEGVVIESGTSCLIKWNSSDNKGIISQEIRLSTDSGITYPTAIAKKLGPDVRSRNWKVPVNLATAKARIKIIARDAAGNQGEGASNSDFFIVNSLPAEAVKIHYDYDKLSRLTNTVSTVVPSLAYTYDALGNRLQLRIDDMPSGAVGSTSTSGSSQEE